MNTHVLSVFAPLLFLSTAVAQGAWIQLQPVASPPARAMCGFVAMQLQNECVLYGGEVAQSGATLGDTWTWNGTSWQQETPAASPGLLEGHAMTYDLLRDRAVLFSGWNGNNYPAQTWEWDGTTWQQRTSAVSPPGRDWSALVYDFAQNNSVLFGGHDWQAPNGSVGDTWTWDGTNWTQHAVSGPAARWGHAMVFDPGRNAVILFGGTPDTGGTGNETWEWNGTAWTQLAPATVPPARRWHGMLWDPNRGRVVMTGGEWQGAQLTDVWEWNGVDWQLAGVTGGPPSGKALHGLVHDPVLNEIVHFGGAAVPDRGGSSDETWMLVANGAAYATWGTYGAGCGAGNGVSFYEVFDGSNPFDMAPGNGFSMFPAAPSYVVLPGLNPIVPPSGAPVTFTDDDTNQITLPWPFPRWNGTLTSDVWVCSNGWIALEPTTATTLTESVADLLSGPERICPMWDDLNPSSGGTIHAEQDPANASLFHVTFTGVPEYSNTGANDFQVTFDVAGSIEVKYGSTTIADALVGYSPGNGARDRGGIDVSAINGLTLDNDLPAIALRSQGTRPVIGTSFALEIVDLPPTATAAALLFSTTRFDPGIDLTAAGFGGCSLYVGGDFSAPLAITGSTAQIALPIPSPTTLQGMSLFVQGAATGVTNVAPIPAGFTNGGEMKIGAM